MNARGCSWQPFPAFDLLTCRVYGDAVSAPVFKGASFSAMIQIERRRLE